MREELRAYLTRDNVIRRQLLVDGSVVTEGAVTRAVLKVGDICIDTDVAADPIELVNTGTVVEFQLGQVLGLTKGVRSAVLYIYDAEHPEGLWWESYRVRVEDGAGCE